MDTQKLLVAASSLALAATLTACSSGSSNDSATTSAPTGASTANAQSSTTSDVDCAAVTSALEQIQLDTQDINAATSAGNNQEAVASLQKEATAAAQLVDALGSAAPESASQWLEQTQQAVAQIVEAAGSGDTAQATQAAAALGSSQYQQLTEDVRSAAEEACNL